jgi:hypothetical protein
MNFTGTILYPSYNIEFDAEKLILKVYDNKKELQPDSLAIKNIVRYLKLEMFLVVKEGQEAKLRLEILRPQS